jgi:hypothetical protein
MAFIFNPNPNEGDKQTNDETGVEYVFSDGAWRPLGPKIEDEFGTLDGRYIKLQDTSFLGDYYRLRGPNAAGTGISTFQVIDEGEQKLYNIKTPESDNEGWAANVEYVNDTVSDYLPLTGGTIAGELYIDVNADGVHDLGFAPRDADNTSVIYSMNGGICRLRSLAGNNIGSVDVRTHFGWGRNADGDPETVLYWLNDPVDAHHAANKRYVDDNCLSLTGGEMTGKLTINSTDAGKIDLRGTSNCDIRRNGTFMISLQQDKIGFSQHLDVNNHRIKNLAAPDLSSDAATKSYVDTSVSGIGRNYPGLRFKFSSGTAASLGKFNYYDSGGLRLRISNNSQDYKWNDGGLDVDYSFSEGHRFSIYEKLSDGSLKIIRTGTYNRADYHSGDVLFRVSSHQTNGSFNTSSEYYLSISGFF